MNIVLASQEELLSTCCREAAELYINPYSARFINS